MEGGVKMEVNQMFTECSNVKIRNIGDKVVIREDLKEGSDYGVDSVVYDMLDYRGQIATITGFAYIGSSYEYDIDLDNGTWGWTEEMLKDVEGEV